MIESAEVMEMLKTTKRGESVNHSNSIPPSHFSLFSLTHTPVWVADNGGPDVGALLAEELSPDPDEAEARAVLEKAMQQEVNTGEIVRVDTSVKDNKYSNRCEREQDSPAVDLSAVPSACAVLCV